MHVEMITHESGDRKLLIVDGEFVDFLPEPGPGLHATESPVMWIWIWLREKLLQTSRRSRDINGEFSAAYAAQVADGDAVAICVRAGMRFCQAWMVYDEKEMRLAVQELEGIGAIRSSVEFEIQHRMRAS